MRKAFVDSMVCALGVLFGVGSVGCEVKPAQQATSAPSASSSQQPTAAGSEAGSAKISSAAPSEVDLVLVDEKQFQETIDKHRGKVVLVDFWATWCQSCVEHFPETVTLHNEHASEGLAAVTVNFDELASADAVKEFLMETRAGALDNLQSNYDGVGTEVPTAFDFEGVLPHYRLYDRTGTLRYRWDEPPADLKEKIAELLAEPAAS